MASIFLCFCVLVSTTLSTLVNGSPIFHQQGNKLVGVPKGASRYQGVFVDTSTDGSDAVISARDSVFIFSRSGATWQQTKQLSYTIFNSGVEFQGALAMSGDGNTVVVGRIRDNSDEAGENPEALVFSRINGVWDEEPIILQAADGETQLALLGPAVDVSRDGDTVILGMNSDNSRAGAAAIFVRSGSSWIQQGSKLVGTDGSSTASQGRAVALSANGDVAAVSGSFDSSGIGATWIFVRSGGVWTQQGEKLVGTGAIGSSAQQGYQVALSDDGNILIVSSIFDASQRGAIWVFTRTEDEWTQQGSKLSSEDVVDSHAQQGISMGITGDGTTIMWGAPGFNGTKGAAFVFSLQKDGTWVQQGSKLVGTGTLASASQGYGGAISGDGRYILVGGPQDSPRGATWVFANSLSTQSPTQSPTETGSSAKVGLPVVYITAWLASMFLLVVAF